LTSSFLTQSFFGERFAHNKLYVKIWPKTFLPEWKWIKLTPVRNKHD
jgi:hypothetical protein